MDISEKHQQSKQTSYWDDLVLGKTSRYKLNALDDLFKRYFKSGCDRILDVGCGTCEAAFEYKSRYQATDLVGIDYDEAIIAQMREKYPVEADWVVADIFNLPEFGRKFDLVLFFDMLHEIYSFYGRPDRDVARPVDHAAGQQFVIRALENISGLVNPGGGIVITDNVLSPSNGEVQVKCKNEAVVEAVKYFVDNYPTRNFSGIIQPNGTIRLSEHDLCILLTQYNKVKNKDWTRWNVERLEIHQYMTEEEYRDVFEKLGFSMHATIETPDYVSEEWHNDFEIIGGMDDFPQKRVTLLAIKN